VITTFSGETELPRKRKRGGKLVQNVEGGSRCPKRRIATEKALMRRGPDQNVDLGPEGGTNRAFLVGEERKEKP